MTRTITSDGASDALTGDALRDFMLGNGGNDILKGAGAKDDLDGGPGSDTADYRDKTAAVVVTLNGGTDVTVSVGGVAEDTISSIENILGGSAGDRLTGDSLANVFRGGPGADILDGAGGADTADYSDKTTPVVVTLNGATNVSVKVNGVNEDTIRNIENVTGGTAADGLTGDSLNNVLNGSTGADLMRGVGGNDVYVVDNAGDVVDESVAGSGGTDGVQSSITFSLSDTVHAKGSLENLTLLGGAAINATGNSLANTLTGNTGTNTLRGLGGNDTYVIQNSTDVVDESVSGSGGTDTVHSSVTFSLSDTVHAKGTLEHLQLTGSAAINATGNSLGNTLTGNSAANSLNGLTGADLMRGVGGNDTYAVDNAGDVVDESLSGSSGTDTVQSSLTFSLSDTVHTKGSVENLTLLGSSAINATGNTLANVLTGNAGTNVLTGLGGNDTYVVQNATDIVDESVAGSGGTDTVQSAVTFSLSDGAHAKGSLEHLALTGSAAANATGNSLANTITGNNAANRINGLLGNDVLNGLAGNDIFRFDTALNSSTNVDFLVAFDVDEPANAADSFDTIELENTVFTQLPAGDLSPSSFATVADPILFDRGSTISYVIGTGEIYYDTNGNVAGGATLFARVDPGTPLSHADFFIT